MAADRLARKIAETIGLRRRRKDRRLDPDISEFGAPHRTGDRLYDRIFEDRNLVEQPQPNEPPGPAQDVLVSPEGEPVPGVDTPEESPIDTEDERMDDDADTEDPDSQLEENKRALFNTLSELIDLGRIERTEVDIRNYVEEHEDEIGDLLDVLDDVLEMLIMGGDIAREPRTFDQEDGEVDSTPGQKDYDELKPAVGPQSSKGATYTSVISSDQTPIKGAGLSEDLAISRLMSGSSLDAVLDASVDEEVIDLNFKSNDERDQALSRMERVDVPSTNLMKIGDTELQIVRDSRNRADVEQQMDALQNIDFTQSSNEPEPAVEAGAETDVDPEVALDPETTGNTTELWQEVVFSQGDEASEVIDIINSDGPEAALDYLADAGFLDSRGETREDPPWGESDEVFHDEESGLTLSWNSNMGYWGVTHKVSGESEAQEFGAMEAEADLLHGGGDVAPGEYVQDSGVIGSLKHLGHKAKTAVAGGWQVMWRQGPKRTGSREFTDEESANTFAAEINQKHPEANAKAINSRTGRDAYNQYNPEIDESEAQEFGAMEAKKKNALVPSEREKDCPHNLGAWSGKTPNTGTFKCKMCGTKLDPKTKKPVDESVNEQVNISRTGLAVQVAFGNDAQASAAKGALLQYKGIDVVIEADDHNIIVFTTDTDPEEARNRVETILANARVPIESEGGEVTLASLALSIDVYEEVNEAGEEPLGFRYGGADLLPAPVPVGHGISGADEASPETQDDSFPVQQYSVDEVIETLSVDDDVRKALMSTSRGTEAYNLELAEIWDELPEHTRAAIAAAYEKEYGSSAVLGDSGVIGEQAGPIATPDEQKYLQPFHSPDDVAVDETPPEELEGELAPEETAPEGMADDKVWRMDVPESPEDFDNLRSVLDTAQGQDLIASWTHVPAEDAEPEPEPEIAPEPETLPDPESSAEPVSEYRWLNGDDKVDEQEAQVDIDDYDLDGEMGADDSDPGIMKPPSDLEPMPGDVGEFIAVEFGEETEQAEREAFVDWIESETADESTGAPGIQVMGWEMLLPEMPENEIPGDDVVGGGELEPGAAQPAEQIVPPVSPEALVHGPASEAVVNPGLATPEDPAGRHQVKHITKGIKAPRIPWDQKNAEGLPPELQQMLTSYQAALQADPEEARRLAGELKFEMEVMGLDPKEFGITEEEEEVTAEIPPVQEIPEDPFDKAYEPAVLQTVGSGAEAAEEECLATDSKTQRGPKGRTAKE